MQVTCHIASVGTLPPSHWALMPVETEQDALWNEQNIAAILEHDRLLHTIAKADPHEAVAIPLNLHHEEHASLIHTVHTALNNLLNGQEMMYAPHDMVAEITHTMLQKARDIQLETPLSAKPQQAEETRHAKAEKLRGQICVGSHFYDTTKTRIIKSHPSQKKQDAHPSPLTETTNVGCVEQQQHEQKHHLPS